MNGWMQYWKLVQECQQRGYESAPRGSAVKELFAPGPLRFDLREAFPLNPYRRVPLKMVQAELRWKLRGCDDGFLDQLQAEGSHVWDPWANENNNVGPVYGAQWRNFADSKTDQLMDVLCMAQQDPDSRRLLVSSWDPTCLDLQALPPCPVSFQLRIQGDVMHMAVYQRSADLLMGVPFDIAEHALLLGHLASYLGRIPAELTFFYGSAHVYQTEDFRREVERMRDAGPEYNAAIMPIVQHNTQWPETRRIEDLDVITYGAENYRRIVCSDKLKVALV